MYCTSLDFVFLKDKTQACDYGVQVLQVSKWLPLLETLSKAGFQGTVLGMLSLLQAAWALAPGDWGLAVSVECLLGAVSGKACYTTIMKLENVLQGPVRSGPKHRVV